MAKATSGKTVTVEQIKSPIRRPKDQRATLIGLGLNKMHRRRTLADTPQVRGMIAKVAHLVEVRYPGEAAPVEVEPGHAVFECTPGEQHYNPIGVVHGGLALTLAGGRLVEGFLYNLKPSDPLALGESVIVDLQACPRAPAHDPLEPRGLPDRVAAALDQHRPALGEMLHDDAEDRWLQHVPVLVGRLGHGDEVGAEEGARTRWQAVHARVVASQFVHVLLRCVGDPRLRARDA